MSGRGAVSTAFRHPHEHDTVAAPTRVAYRPSKDAEVLLAPEVADLLRPGNADVGPDGRDLGQARAAVEEPDGLGAVFELADPDLDVAVLRGAAAGFAERVLVDVDDVVVGEQAQREVVEAGDVAAEDERRRDERPERDVGVLLVRREGGRPRCRLPCRRRIRSSGCR